MPSELHALHGEEVSLVTRAANRRRFLLKKGDTMALDEVKAIAWIEKLDAAGDGVILELLAADGEPVSDEQKAALLKTGMTHADYKKVRSAMKVMGPDLAKKFPQFAKVLAFDPEDAQDGGDDEQAEDDGDEPKTKTAKGAKVDKSAKAQKGAKGAAGDELPAEVADRLRKADEVVAENQQLVERIQKMEDDNARRVFVTKAAIEYKHIPGASAEDLGGILFKTTKALSKGEQEKLESVLKAADAAIRTGVLKELGSEASDGEGATAQTELDAKVADIQKADTKLTKSQAVAQALKTVPGLMDRINKAADDRVRKARG